MDDFYDFLLKNTRWHRAGRELENKYTSYTTKMVDLVAYNVSRTMRGLVLFLVVGLCLVCRVCSFARGLTSRKGLGTDVLRQGSRHVAFLSNNEDTEKQTPRVRKKNKRDKMIAALFEDTEYHRGTESSAVPLKEDPLIPMVEDIIRAADKRKAKNMKAIRIEHLTEVTTFMVILEGNSRPQNQAIANAIEDEILLNYQDQPKKEGDASSGWVLLDYASVIVHIMTPQMRNFYKLEKRWKDAEELDITPLLLPDVGTGGNYDSSADNEFFEDVGQGEPQEEEDPFWQ